GSLDGVAVLAADAAGGASQVGLAGSAHLPHPLYAALASRLPGLRPADQLLAAVRLLKSDEEIVKMRYAGTIADQALEAAFKTLQAEIGRASCRERVESRVVGGGGKYRG